MDVSGKFMAKKAARETVPLFLRSALQVIHANGGGKSKFAINLSRPSSYSNIANASLTLKTTGSRFGFFALIIPSSFPTSFSRTFL
jgi:hypothetical protein